MLYVRFLYLPGRGFFLTIFKSCLQFSNDNVVASFLMGLTHFQIVRDFYVRRYKHYFPLSVPPVYPKNSAQNNSKSCLFQFPSRSRRFQGFRYRLQCWYQKKIWTISITISGPRDVLNPIPNTDTKTLQVVKGNIWRNYLIYWLGYPKIEKLDDEIEIETQVCAKFDSDTDTRHFGIAILDLSWECHLHRLLLPSVFFIH